MIIKKIKKYPELQEKEFNKLNIKDLYLKMNKILIVRKYGGLGDLNNTIPIFKTIKSLYPDLHITYSLPKLYFPIVEGNPYIDEIIEYPKFNIYDYGYCADISTDCGKYENAMKPYVNMHRSDIWSEMSLGIKLIDHSFDIPIDIVLKEDLGRRLVSKYNYSYSPKIALFPKSASLSKDIPEDILLQLIEKMNSCGYYPCIIDGGKRLKGISIPYITDLTMKEFINMLSLFDYVISVDTGPFHLSAALGIPTVGIFPWTDSKVLSKYHPKVELVQEMHRDNGSKYKCCPCWDWTQCHYKPKTILPLPCMQTNNADKIFQAFKKLIEKYPVK